jgi:hypothetical protein
MVNGKWLIVNLPKKTFVSTKPFSDQLTF